MNQTSKVKECPNCFRLLTFKQSKCPDCGFDFLECVISLTVDETLRPINEDIDNINHAIENLEKCIYLNISDYFSFDFERAFLVLFSKAKQSVYASEALYDKIFGYHCYLKNLFEYIEVNDMSFLNPVLSDDLKVLNNFNLIRASCFEEFLICDNYDMSSLVLEKPNLKSYIVLDHEKPNSVQNEMNEFSEIYTELESFKKFTDLSEELREEIISVKDEIPKIIAYYEALGFIDHLVKTKYVTKRKLYSALAKSHKADERTIKGNILVLNHHSTEDRHRYTSHKYIDTFKTKLNIK